MHKSPTSSQPPQGIPVFYEIPDSYKIPDFIAFLKNIINENPSQNNSPYSTMDKQRILKAYATLCKSTDPQEVKDILGPIIECSLATFLPQAQLFKLLSIPYQKFFENKNQNNQSIQDLQAKQVLLEKIQKDCLDDIEKLIQRLHDLIANLKNPLVDTKDTSPYLYVTIVQKLQNQMEFFEQLFIDSILNVLPSYRSFLAIVVAYKDMDNCRWALKKFYQHFGLFCPFIAEDVEIAKGVWFAYETDTSLSPEEAMLAYALLQRVYQAIPDASKEIRYATCLKKLAALGGVSLSNDEQLPGSMQPSSPFFQEMPQVLQQHEDLSQKLQQEIDNAANCQNNKRLSLLKELQNKLKTYWKNLEGMKSGDQETTKHVKRYESLCAYCKAILCPVQTYLEREKQQKAIKNAKEILQENWFGDDSVLCQLKYTVASIISNTTNEPTLISLEGPPGNGKSSLGQTLANALERGNCEVIHLNAIQDASGLSGHQMVYQGSEPGPLAKIFIARQTTHIVLLFDELCKASEPIQNSLLGILESGDKFVDHYLETSLDFSNVVMVVAFNDKEKLIPALWDRLSIKNLVVPSCNAQQKLRWCHHFSQIAKEKLLFPFAFQESALKRIVEYDAEGSSLRYCKGVIDKVCRTLNCMNQRGYFNINVESNHIDCILGNPWLEKIPQNTTGLRRLILLRDTQGFEKIEKSNTEVHYEFSDKGRRYSLKMDTKEVTLSLLEGNRYAFSGEHLACYVHYDDIPEDPLNSWPSKKPYRYAVGAYDFSETSKSWKQSWRQDLEKILNPRLQDSLGFVQFTFNEKVTSIYLNFQTLDYSSAVKSFP